MAANTEVAPRITLFRTVLDEQAVAAVAEVLRSGWLGLGPRTAAFEQAFAQYVGAPRCVGLNSATSALHLCVKLLDLSEGAQVITTPITFVSTNHVLLYERLEPVFADVDPLSGNIDVASIEARITERTRAIMLVHLGGYPCELDAIYALARARGLPVIEDCAHAAGASYHGRRIGSHGDLHAFSFHAVKNLPMGDGGAITLSDQTLDQRLRRLRWLGISADTYSRAGQQSYKWQYEVAEVGYKYHMNDIQAAIGLVQLARLDADNARRAAIAGAYRRELASVPGVRIPPHRPDRVCSFHLATILVEDRNRLVDTLARHQIDCGVHYRRNDQYRMYREQDLPGVAHYAAHVVSLPLHLGLTDDHVQRVIQVIRAGW